MPVPRRYGAAASYLCRKVGACQGKHQLSFQFSNMASIIGCACSYMHPNFLVLAWVESLQLKWPPDNVPYHVQGNRICDICKSVIQNLPEVTPRAPDSATGTEAENAFVEHHGPHHFAGEQVPGGADVVFDCIRVRALLCLHTPKC